MKLRINKKILILITILIGVTIMFSKMHNTFEFNERINDVGALNQYILSHRPLKLFDLNIEKKNLNKIIFEDSMIEKPRWHEIKIQNSKLINTQIVNGTLENIDFSHSNLTNVTFEKVTFDKVLFDYSKLNNVKFIDCTLKNSSFYQITSSNINFEKTDINDGDFYHAEVNLNMKDSKFNDIDFSYLKGSIFSMQNGELKNSIFDSAHLDELKLNEVYIDGVGCPKSIINTVYIKGGKLDIDIPAADIQKFSIYDSNINTFSLGGAKIKELNISNCKETDQLGFFRGHIDKLTINNCYTNGLDLAKANINELIFSNVSTKESLSDHATINTCRLDNFQISGEIDLSGAMIKNLYTRDFHYDPNAKVKTDESNLEYNAHGLRLKGVWPEVTPDKWLIFRG